MSYRFDDGMESVQYLLVDHGGYSASNQPRGPGYLDTGQIWSITLGREVMDLKSAALVLALLVRHQFLHRFGGRWADQGRFVHYRFLASYLCAWQLAREWVSCPFFFQLHEAPPVAIITFAMRWLCPTEQLPGFVGFLLQRERGLLPKPAGRPPVLVREGRISFRFVTSLGVPPVFNTVILQDFPVDRSNLGPKLFESKFNRMRVVGESSISILQLVFVNTLENTWYKGWMRLLDEIDDCVKVQVSRSSPKFCVLWPPIVLIRHLFRDMHAANDVLDTTSAEGLMRDDSLAHSKLYFQLLQLLRIIPLWIQETRYDLEKLQNDCNRSVLHPIPGLSRQPFLPTAEIVRQNWDEVLSRFHVLESELQRRIDAKTDEIRGLRDGLFSASSLQEAHKATSMNRYIIIFTTVTIFYLPPAFVTAVFSMDLLHDENLNFLKGTYAVTIVTVSVVTYIEAFGLVLFVDRRKVMPLLIGRLQSMVPAFLAPKKDTAPSGMPTEITEKEWLENGQSGPWSGFLAAPAPTARQRRRWGKKKADDAGESEGNLSV